MEKTLHSIVEISKQINSVLDIDQLLETIMDAAIQSVGVERGILFLKMPDGALQPRAARNVEKETIVNAEEISRSIIAEVVSSGKYFLSSNIQDDPSLLQKPSVREFKILSVLCMPLVNKSTTIGTIYLDSRKATKLFSDLDVEFLQTFANLAAIAISNAHLFEATKNEARYWKQEAAQQYELENIIYASEIMGTLCSRARSVAHTTMSVLITGESGTGKELFARAIHYQSTRRDSRFVPINCSALPEQILESELFGVKKGAYTGAVSDAKGLFEEANGGTIFLDEIADMQPSLQAKLLRVLQEGEIRRVGDTQYRYMDVRVISATNKDIREEIRDGRFREDLYYRLCGLELHIPPLRKRQEDIAPLTQRFVHQYCEKNHSTRKSFSDSAMKALQEYSFPGNVRELNNIIQKAILFSGNREIIEEIEIPKIDQLRDDPEDFSEATRQHILKILEKVEWNQTRAAELLGLNRTTLQAKMKKLNITRSNPF